jgi:hypothetical protein
MGVCTKEWKGVAAEVLGHSACVYAFCGKNEKKTTKRKKEVEKTWFHVTSNFSTEKCTGSLLTTAR